MKRLLLLITVLISMKSFAQTDNTMKRDSVKTAQYPSLNTMNNYTPQQLNNYVGDDLNSYSNEARIGLLMEASGIVFGLGGAFLSINSVSSTPINASLISGAVLTFAGFIVHYDSYRFLKHASRLLKLKKQ